MRDLQTGDPGSGISLALFSLRSLFTEYGAGFLTRVIVRYPLRTWRGLRRFRASERRETPFAFSGGPDSLVGLRFCLKPTDPPCLSGRANHECRYFEEAMHRDPVPLPACCEDCQIRLIGERALEAGSDLYIMTSAQDILRDVLMPALEGRRFDRALLALCRYSFRPFRLALHIVGIEARLFAYQDGDCRSYRDWRRADKGFKDERTRLADVDRKTLLDLLTRKNGRGGGIHPFRWDGRVFRNPGTPPL